VTLVWVSIVMFVLVAFVALGVDWGYAYYTTQKLQNAADAAALAGAQSVWSSHADARQRAMTFSSENEAGGDVVLLHENATNDPVGDIVIGVYDVPTRQFTPNEEEGVANAVMVSAKRTTNSPNGALPLVFGRVLGFNSTQFSRWAIAVCERAPEGPGIILLRPSGPKGLEHSGNGTVTVYGKVQINSTDSSEALYKSGNGTLEATSFEVVGGSKTTATVIGDINEGVDPVADPYAGVPVPNFLNNSIEYPIRSSKKLSLGNGQYTLYPGRYIGGIDLNGSDGQYTFTPGIYIIEGGGFKLSSAPYENVNQLVMNEVMIYNCGTGGTTSNADQFVISTQGGVTWTPYKVEPYAGFGLFQHRNLADKKVQISGNGNVNITAIIYAKTAEVQLSGNGTTDVLGGGFVAASMQISGDGTFTVGGDENTSAGGEKIYLAE
jgi:hypothetical protein